MRIGQAALTAMLVSYYGLGLGQALAKDVHMAVPRSVPPYVISQEWGGIEYDIVKRSLALAGHTIVPALTVLARVPKELASGGIDAGMTMRPELGVDACYSIPHVTYRNYVITLDKADVKIDTMADLSGKTIVAFQNAHIYLGEDFARAVATSSSYREEANQVTQALLLFSGRIQAVVADYNIFRWHAAEVATKVDVTQKLRLHPLFPPLDHYVAFRDPALCAQFNQGLAQLRASGEYDQIVQRYLTRMERNLAQAPR